MNPVKNTIELERKQNYGVTREQAAIEFGTPPQQQSDMHVELCQLIVIASSTQSGNI